MNSNSKTAMDQEAYDAQIFVNYRREDEPFGAALIDGRLSARFGCAAVFRASRSIPVGADFVNCLLTTLRRCAILLAVIGPRWLAGPCGASRLHGPFDWVRREIAEAFDHGVRVVPVLLNADLPSARDLPADIAVLARCQYHRVHYRTADQDIDHLIDKLSRLLPNLGPQSSGPGERNPFRLPPTTPSTSLPTSRHLVNGADQADVNRFAKGLALVVDDGWRRPWLSLPSGRRKGDAVP